MPTTPRPGPARPSRQRSTFCAKPMIFHWCSSFFSGKRSGQDSPPAFSFAFLELLERRHAKHGVESLAINQDRVELRQVRPNGNFVILIAFIPLQLSELDPFRVAL